MFPGGFFAKDYFAGTYWPPVDGVTAGGGDPFLHQEALSAVDQRGASHAGMTSVSSRMGSASGRTMSSGGTMREERGSMGLDD